MKLNFPKSLWNYLIYIMPAAGKPTLFWNHFPQELYPMEKSALHLMLKTNMMSYCAIGKRLTFAIKFKRINRLSHYLWNNNRRRYNNARSILNLSKSVIKLTNTYACRRQANIILTISFSKTWYKKSYKFTRLNKFIYLFCFCSTLSPRAIF